jgi:hypothetical protein
MDIQVRYASLAKAGELMSLLVTLSQTEQVPKGTAYRGTGRAENGCWRSRLSAGRGSWMVPARSWAPLGCLGLDTHMLSRGYDKTPTRTSARVHGRFVGDR